MDERIQDKPAEETAEETIGELEKAQAEAAEYLERLQRLQAEFANYKKRIEREHGEFVSLANGALISKLLPILDDLGRALENVPDKLQGTEWLDGIRLIERALQTTLEQEGLTEIEALGKKFDPQFHHAVVREETTEYEDDEIIGELQRGYRLQDRVLRPSMVIVAARPGNQDKREND
ncbi:MAG: nucleotide exchange factor GrpE [Anaerolineae bacterium]|nr:nucleotide exchange factor GrpE [Anaerolineae bacterium]